MTYCNFYYYYFFPPSDLQSRGSAKGLFPAPEGVPDKAGGPNRASLP